MLCVCVCVCVRARACVCVYKTHSTAIVKVDFRILIDLHVMTPLICKVIFGMPCKPADYFHIKLCTLCVCFLPVLPMFKSKKVLYTYSEYVL
jgi:hypothetical protein